jgi:hypothetical protein
VSRQQLLISVGTVIGHWTVVALLGHRLFGRKSREVFQVRAACSDYVKDVHRAALLDSVENTYCVRCVPRPEGRPVGRKSGTMRKPNYVRCRHPRRIGDLASTVACGGLVEVGKEQDHLRDVHRTEGGDWFEALRPSRDEEEAA